VSKAIFARNYSYWNNDTVVQNTDITLDDGSEATTEIVSLSGSGI